MAIQIDVVVVVIDRVHENTTFMHFVGMPISGPERRPKMGWFYMVVCMGHHTNYP